MYLQTLHIKHFRNIDDLTLTFRPGLNVIVGENNIGKTNIIEAIRIALGLSQATKEDLPLTAEAESPISITLIYQLESEDENAQFIDILNFNPAAPLLSTAQINFEWTYNRHTTKWSRKRWGGTSTETERSVPDEILQALKTTVLGALRDAVAELRPGYKSKLGSLISLLATNAEKATILEHFQAANENLRQDGLIVRTSSLLQDTLTGTSGDVLAQKASIATSESEFDKIVRNLKILIGHDSQLELSSNGLGYNNLLFIACVISELGSSTEGDYPLLLVEEPEAHLHPQLQTILANFLAEGISNVPDIIRKPQIIITTHSPTIAAHVLPSQIRYVYYNHEKKLKFFSWHGLFEKPEENKLRRMLDVTRASMLFAKGIIFVEGESESILLPVLSQREDLHLQNNAISIVPVCGVNFDTLASLYGEDKIEIKVALLTDGDPTIVNSSTSEEYTWKNAIPKRDGNGAIITSDRVSMLKTTYENNTMVKPFVADVTLEYDLANAGASNPATMVQSWEKCFASGASRTLNRDILTACTNPRDKVLAVWRGICLSCSTVSKPVFSQQLAEDLSIKDANRTYAITKTAFATPNYIKGAFRHVLNLSAEEGNNADS